MLKTRFLCVLFVAVEDVSDKVRKGVDAKGVAGMNAHEGQAKKIPTK